MSPQKIYFLLFWGEFLTCEGKKISSGKLWNGLAAISDAKRSGQAYLPPLKITVASVLDRRVWGLRWQAGGPQLSFLRQPFFNHYYYQSSWGWVRQIENETMPFNPFFFLLRFLLEVKLGNRSPTDLLSMRKGSFSKLSKYQSVRQIMFHHQIKKSMAKSRGLG